MVQVSGSPERAELTALAQGLLPARGELTDGQYDEQVAATLKLLTSEHGFHGRQVVSCVPASDLHLQSVRLPLLPPAELEKVVRWEAQERLPFPAANAELRYLQAGQIRQDANVKQEVVLMACQQTVLQRHLRILESAALVPVAIDVEPCAVLRAFRNGQSDNNDRVAYLHLGDSLTTVFIADGDTILFLKYVGCGGRELPVRFAAQSALSTGAREAPVADPTVALTRDPPLPGLDQLRAFAHAAECAAVSFADGVGRHRRS